METTLVDWMVVRNSGKSCDPCGVENGYGRRFVFTSCESPEAANTALDKGGLLRFARGGGSALITIVLSNLPSDLEARLREDIEIAAQEAGINPLEITSVSQGSRR